MFNIPGSSDRLGVGLWWQDLSHRDLDDQSGMEVFYRWDVLANVAITPSFQLLIEPALAPDKNTIFLFALRARVVFF